MRKFNEYGFDEYGYDIGGYDKDGFDEMGYNRFGRKKVINKNKNQSEQKHVVKRKKEKINFKYKEYKNSNTLNIIEEKKEKIIINQIEKRNRNIKIINEVLLKYDYKCQYNEEHKTFISGTTNQQYMEAHHLIPMNAQDSFKNSLDVLGNVVSLCPNCHRMIHHGDEASKNIIIEKLYIQKEKELRKFGLEIILEDLKKLYK